MTRKEINDEIMSEKYADCDKVEVLSKLEKTQTEHVNLTYVHDNLLEIIGKQNDANIKIACDLIDIALTMLDRSIKKGE